MKNARISCKLNKALILAFQLSRLFWAAYNSSLLRKFIFDKYRPMSFSGSVLDLIAFSCSGQGPRPRRDHAINENYHWYILNKSVHMRAISNLR